MQFRSGSWLTPAILAVIAGCSGPFVADHSTGAAARAYTDCVYGYASTRLDYKVTAEELADAAIGACPAQLNDVREVYVRSLGRVRADRNADNFMLETRGGVLTAIVEARHSKKPLQFPADPTGI